MKVKPIRRGMWSCWHKTRAKQKHIYSGNDFHYATVKRGMRYIWHYYKYHWWLEKRRFDMSKAKQIKPYPNWMIKNREYNKKNK